MLGNMQLGATTDGRVTIYEDEGRRPVDAVMSVNIGSFTMKLAEVIRRLRQALLG